MLATPPSRASGLSTRSVSYETRGRYDRLIRSLYDIQSGDEGPELVEVSPAAFRLLKRYADANARRMDAAPEGPVRAVLGKRKRPEAAPAPVPNRDVMAMAALFGNRAR